MAIVLLADVRSAIGFSSFTVLLYYAITNVSAHTLKPYERLFSRKLATLGLVGCLVLAFALPLASVIAGSGIVLLGLAIYAIHRQGRSERPRSQARHLGGEQAKCVSDKRQIN